jgi:hypothetical protein
MSDYEDLDADYSDRFAKTENPGRYDGAKLPDPMPFSDIIQPKPSAPMGLSAGVILALCVSVLIAATATAVMAVLMIAK